MMDFACATMMALWSENSAQSQSKFEGKRSKIDQDTSV